MGRREQSVVRALGGRTEQAGMFLAAASVPATFQRTLMPRSLLDQGLVTGITMAMSYAVGATVQDGVEVLALKMARRRGPEPDDRTRRRVAMSLDLGAIGLGLVAQNAFRQRPRERLGRATARTAGYWMTVGGVAGFAAGLIQDVLHTVDHSAGEDRDYRSLPVAMLAGGGMAGALAWMRGRRLKDDRDDQEAAQVALAKSLGLGAGVSLVLGGLATAERGLAHVVGRALGKLLPGPPRLWRPFGHLASLGLIGGTLVEGLRQVEHRIERGASHLEPAFHDAPTSSLVSGGPGSAVPWDTMSKQGRRNVSTVLDRDRIEEVMGEPALADPIRVFVGLDTAPTAEERVRLAMEDLERTGAFDRRLLMVISPTGTGYVNYVAVESAEFMTRGDVASVTLQYSKRPSPLSLDAVKQQQRQYRMLVEAVSARLDRVPEADRPRVVLFGESLGALTSEDSFLGEGTRGLEDLGVDRGLWIGTPFETKWKDQVLSPDPDPAVDPTVVGRFDSFEELEALDPEARKRLRYVMVTHYNDGVALFAPSLLVQKPDWLGDGADRHPTIPPGERYGTPSTFVLTLMDMKNAANVVPGQFERKGHDYRADLARFVREVYDLEATDEQMPRIEDALRRLELDLKHRVDTYDRKKKKR